MDRVEYVRKIVRDNRIRFLNLLLTKIFLEGFPGLHHSTRNKISCTLDNKGEFHANSELLDAILKVDNFPEKFIKFCVENDCCDELRNLIQHAWAQRNHNENYHVHVPAEPLYDHNVTAPELHCRTSSIESNVNQDNLQYCGAHTGSTLPLEPGFNNMDCCPVDGIVKNIGIECVPLKDAHSTNRTGLNDTDNNIDNTQPTLKLFYRVKDIDGISAGTRTLPESENDSISAVWHKQQSKDSSLESIYSSSFELSYSDINIGPDNEIETLKENSPLENLQISSSTDNGNHQPDITTDSVEDSVINAHNGKSADADLENTLGKNTGTTGVISLNLINPSGILCEKDLPKQILTIKYDDVPLQNINETLNDEMLQSICTLSAISESEELDSESYLKQVMTEPTVEENGDTDFVFPTFTCSTFGQYNSVHEEDIMEEPEISLDSTLSDKSNTSTDNEILISVESNVPDNIAFQQQSHIFAHEDIDKETEIEMDSTSSDKNDTSSNIEVDAFGELNVPGTIAIQQQSSFNTTPVFHYISLAGHFVFRHFLNSL